ncbi:hypothetical protein AK830_g4627 [Neonectria ditissima]|uniref:Uncharacterized protein n=1 Tax=Neonectria ditissima TaxID=78410 RepID=A0A0P7BKX3_9HYPO|nr:hypothetical protein AK830_g4627 [Neonectria ditissima]
MSPSDQQATGQESRLNRALLALPILALAGIMARAFAMAEPIGPVLENILETAHFDWNGMSVPILREFYGIKLLDEIFSHITIAFAQLQFFNDPRAYWQSLVFLTDFAGMYAVLFLESCRQTNRKTLFQFPFLLVFLAQILGIGNLGPLYFYLYYVFTPVEKVTAEDFALTDWASCAAVLPTVVLVYHVPHLPSYFHQSLEARNWWNWVWQLFPVWGSVLMFVLTNMLSLGTAPKSLERVKKPQINTLRATVGVLAAVNVAIYWYTLYNSKFSLSELFIPKYFSENPQEPDVALRTIIQYDYLCTFSGGILWLAYSFRDLEVAGFCKFRYLRTICIAGVIAAVFSPGTLFLVAWLAREELLASNLE